ncbi:hypothetical protein vBPFY1MI_134 [Pseudomonas phage vB_PF_Y1-MI]|nr:hypothetical protein vBPFY1MI_134 [Pseudomonas phage vB_PF_Y1-MI]
MWPFKKKEKPKKIVYMFDMDNIRELESLTPEQIVTLISMAAVGILPDNAVLYSVPEHIKPLVKEVEV